MFFIFCEKSGKGFAFVQQNQHVKNKYIDCYSIFYALDCICGESTFTFQISCAYSVIVRSDENFPALATLIIDCFVHSFWS